MEIEFVIRLPRRHELRSERAIDITPRDGLAELEKGALTESIINLLPSVIDNADDAAAQLYAGCERLPLHREHVRNFREKEDGTAARLAISFSLRNAQVDLAFAHVGPDAGPFYNA
ncbi:hypothetical protein PUN28_017225 [Cardiocondyla obscurior]|uniref:Uncharacterized protein n=1 Tax=Cardiocondyla obscurior TaxID=286306 RepID=A0AAW2EKU8_9HYME